jgi:hypothetical protein
MLMLDNEFMLPLILPDIRRSLGRWYRGGFIAAGAGYFLKQKIKYIMSVVTYKSETLIRKLQTHKK